MNYELWFVNHESWVVNFGCPFLNGEQTCETTLQHTRHFKTPYFVWSIGVGWKGRATNATGCTEKEGAATIQHLFEAPMKLLCSSWTHLWPQHDNGQVFLSKFQAPVLNTPSRNPSTNRAWKTLQGREERNTWGIALYTVRTTVTMFFFHSTFIQ